MAKDIIAIEAYYAEFGTATADRVVAAIKTAAESLASTHSLEPKAFAKGLDRK